MSGPMIIEYDGGAPPVDLKDKVPLADLLKDEQKRWQMKTHLGILELKRITRLATESVAIKLANRTEQYFKLAEAKQPLWEKMKAGIEMTPEELEEAALIASQIAPYVREFSLPCFTDPILKTIEEFDALLTHLYPDEQQQLGELLQELIKPVFDGPVETSQLRVAKEFGIPLNNKLTMENMTARQFTALADQLNADGRDTEKAVKELVAVKR